MKTNIGYNSSERVDINDPAKGWRAVYYINMELREEDFKDFLEALALAGTKYSHSLLMQTAKLIRQIQLNND